VSDYQDDTDTETSPLEFNISAMQQQGDYVLVGNPFMVSIDMKKFFEYNTELSSTDGYCYWTCEGSVAEAHEVPATAKTTVIKPLQAFFVKKGTATKLTFNKEMQIDGNFPTPPATPAKEAPALMLTAENEQGLSKASVVMDEGQNVETLFDSNLANVPMVYTVADGQALSINHSSLFTQNCTWYMVNSTYLHSSLPFGVVCNSQDDVEVTLTGVDNVEGELYVVDAVNGMKTEVSEGSTVTVTPNEYGRYFLVRGSATGVNELEGLSNGIRVSVREGMVTVSAARNLGSVRAVNISGATVYQATDCGNSVQFQLPNDVYILETNGEAGKKRIKIYVR
jgi:hypothetical protein